MAKQIVFTYDGDEYILEYTRNTIKQMEARGFKVQDMQTKPMTTLPLLWAGAFLCHHKHTKQDLINKMYDLMKNKEELFDTLAEMYAEPLTSLFEEPEEGLELKWEVRG